MFGNQTFVSEQTLTQTVSSVMKRVYVRMTLALLVTAVTSLWAASSEMYFSFISQNSRSMWVLLIAEVGLVIAIWEPLIA